MTCVWLILHPSPLSRRTWREVHMPQGVQATNRRREVHARSEDILEERRGLERTNSSGAWGAAEQAGRRGMDKGRQAWRVGAARVARTNVSGSFGRADAGPPDGARDVLKEKCVAGPTRRRRRGWLLVHPRRTRGGVAMNTAGCLRTCGARVVAPRWQGEWSSPKILRFFEKKSVESLFYQRTKTTHSEKEGECWSLESHPPTQARSTLRHPPPRMKGSTARAHRRDATAAHWIFLD